jgi:PAS domain S-box-containing protein
MNSKILATADENRTLIVVSFFIFALCFIVAAMLYLKEQQVQKRVNLLEQLSTGEHDLSRGLLHLTQSSDGYSPWKKEVGIALLSQSLSSYEAIIRTADLQLENNNINDVISDFKKQLQSLRDGQSDQSLNISHSVFVLTSQINELERSLKAQLDQQIKTQTTWFGAVLFICLTLISLLGLTLLRAKEQRAGLHEQLRLSQQRFMQLAENIDEIFWLEDVKENKVLYVSPAFEKIWGRSNKEVLENIEIWFEHVHPEDKEKVGKMREQALHQPLTIEYRIITKNGDVRWISDRCFPIFSDGSNSQYPDQIAAVATDITEQRSISQQLFHAQKIESLGQLTSGVAHDFNNLLTVILGNAELLHEKLQADPHLGSISHLIIRAAVRGSSLNQQLLAFASKQQLQPEITHIQQLISETTQLLERTLGPNIALDIRLPPLPLYAKIDQGQLQNALLNLCLNSRDAMPEGGKICIEMDCFKEGETSSTMLHIKVSDSGCGISADLLDRVVDPFFTTKAAGKGTGLGLSMVFGFVRQSGGYMNIQSEQGMGTTIHIYIPEIQNTTHASVPIQRSPDSKQTKTILLVEDDAMVRQSTKRMLKDAGYDIIEAENGEIAFQTLVQRTDIDLVFTDVVMPGRYNGFDVAKEARTLYPNVAVLVTSGYTGSIKIPHDYADLSPILQKPYTKQILLNRIHEAISLTVPQ